ncbi:MAG: hypothetical protein ACJASM_003044 [Salibacteraceae bacterium]|jgi:hypothetical protein
MKEDWTWKVQLREAFKKNKSILPPNFLNIIKIPQPSIIIHLRYKVNFPINLTFRQPFVTSIFFF